MPVVAGIGAAVLDSGVQAINSADAASKANALAQTQYNQEQASIATAQNQQSEYIRQQALIGQRDAGLAAQYQQAAFRSNFAGTNLTQPGGVTPQAGMSMTKIGG